VVQAPVVEVRGLQQLGSQGEVRRTWPVALMDLLIHQFVLFSGQWHSIHTGFICRIIILDDLLDTWMVEYGRRRCDYSCV
jgi:hypothetical protein